MAHKCTWEQHIPGLKSIIDYLIIKQDTKLQIQDVRVQRGAACGSDHYVVRHNISKKERNKT